MVFRNVEAEKTKDAALLLKSILDGNHFTDNLSVALLMKYFDLINNFIQIKTNENSVKFRRRL